MTSGLEFHRNMGINFSAMSSRCRSRVLRRAGDAENDMPCTGANVFVEAFSALLSGAQEAVSADDVDELATVEVLTAQ